jgi:hypothetical protein
MNNTEKVIDILRQHGAMRICDLMRKSGVKNTYQIVNDLTKDGRVIKQKLSGQYVKVSLPAIKSESSDPPPKKVAHPLERHMLSLTFEVGEIERQIRSLEDARTFLLSRMEAITEKLKSL